MVSIANIYFCCCFSSTSQYAAAAAVVVVFVVVVAAAAVVAVAVGGAAHADIDECAEGSDNCSPSTQCINADGSFACTCRCDAEQCQGGTQ